MRRLDFSANHCSAEKKGKVPTPGAAIRAKWAHSTRRTTRPNSKFAKKCYRTLLLAYADYDEARWENLKSSNNDFATIDDKEAAEVGLTMIGIMALQDPLRPGIAEAVRSCHEAGINVRMVTGDNLETAQAIARKACILSDADLHDDEENYVCMTG